MKINLIHVGIWLFHVEQIKMLLLLSRWTVNDIKNRIGTYCTDGLMDISFIVEREICK